MLGCSSGSPGRSRGHGNSTSIRPDFPLASPHRGFSGLPADATRIQGSLTVAVSPQESLEMTYQMQSLNLAPATLDGLSGRLIDSHHANNYGGAVKRLNAIRAQLERLAQQGRARAADFVLNSLERAERIPAKTAFLPQPSFHTPGAHASPQAWRP